MIFCLCAAINDTIWFWTPIDNERRCYHYKDRFYCERFQTLKNFLTTSIHLLPTPPLYYPYIQSDQFFALIQICMWLWIELWLEQHLRRGKRGKFEPKSNGFDFYGRFLIWKTAKDVCCNFPWEKSHPEFSMHRISSFDFTWRRKCEKCHFFMRKENKEQCNASINSFLLWMTQQTTTTVCLTVNFRLEWL